MQELTDIAVILNASAGAGCTAEFANDLTNQFRTRELSVHVTLATSGAEVIEAAQRAVGKGVKMVVAGGGDGTMNAVASALIGSDIALGVLPLGTLNHFAKDLHIPLDLDDAIRTIAEGYMARIDVGEINDHIFLNNSSLGLYPDAVRRRERQQRRLGRGKWLSLFWATVTALRRYPFLNVTFVVEGEEFHRRTPFIFIGNNEYLMEGFNIGGRERLDAACLSLYVTQRTGRLGLLFLAMRALFGRLRQAKDFDVLIAKRILIKTHHQQIRVATDGEVTLMNTPLRCRIRPAVLNVIVPKNSQKKGDGHAYARTPV